MKKNSILSLTVQYVWFDYKTNFPVISKMYLNILICLEIKNQGFKKTDQPLLDFSLSPILLKRIWTPATQEYTRQEAAQWKENVEKYHNFIDETLIILWQKLFPIKTVK